MAALLALACAAVYGGADFLGGLASRRHAATSVALLATMSGVIGAALLWLIAGGTWSTDAVVLGGAGGLCGMVGIVMLYQGLATGPFQLVSPVAAVLSAIVPVGFGVIGGERPSLLGVVGLALALPSIWLLSGGTTSAPRNLPARPLLLAGGAGFAFGGFFVLLAVTPDGSGLVPVVAAKSAAAAILGLASIRRLPPRLPTSDRRLAVGSGLLDMSANGLFLAASKLGDLSVVGALAALFPASNALLARVVLDERLTRTQFVGFLAALASGALLSA